MNDAEICLPRHSSISAVFSDSLTDWRASSSAARAGSWAFASSAALTSARRFGMT